MLKKEATATVYRTAICGGGLSYDVLVPIKYVENYTPSRYTTVVRDGKQFLRYPDATMPEEHYSMSLGWDRYDHAKSHETVARKEMLTLARKAFPELGKFVGDSLPSLWVTGLLEKETSKKKTIAI